MSTDDVVTLVSKLHVDPSTVLVLTVPEDAAWRAHDTLTAIKAALPTRLQDVPMFALHEGFELSTLSDAEARQFYDALKRRLGAAA